MEVNKSIINRKVKDKIKELENEKIEKDNEIEQLEKEYLEKIAKLLVMTQVHCEIKTDIYNQFGKLGITSHVENVDDQSFSKNP